MKAKTVDLVVLSVDLENSHHLDQTGTSRLRAEDLRGQAGGMVPRRDENLHAHPSAIFGSAVLGTRNREKRDTSRDMSLITVKLMLVR